VTPRGSAERELVCGELSIDRDARSVRVGQRVVVLTRKEYELLVMLARNPGVVLRREQLLSGVWGNDWASATHTLDVHVASLRRKLDRAAMIETVRGVGYRVADPLG
jgi:DNA-binding response OmpR family regulator